MPGPLEPAALGPVHHRRSLSRRRLGERGGRTLAYAYDAAGDRTAITWPDTGANALTATHGFDTLQRVTTITVGGTQIAAYGYDSSGRRQAITRANGAGAGTSYGYDGTDRISSLTQSLTGGAAVTWTLGYDPSNALVSRQVSNGPYTWHPGAASVAYTANGLNQYTTLAPGGTSVYDYRGDTTFDAASATNFTYDLENRLTAASAPTAVTLAYDAAGRPRTKTASGVADTFLYAGTMLVGEYNSSGTILSRYIPGPAPDEAALMYAGAGTTTPQWLHADAQGSTIAWSNAAGASLGTLAYDPWGQPSAWSGPRYSYTGQLMLPEARLYHDKARAYSPGLGRFLQTDPAGFAGGVNLYAYAGNDPVNGVDPSGMTVGHPAPVVCVGGVCPGASSVSQVVVNGAGQGPRSDFTGPAGTIFVDPQSGTVWISNGDGTGQLVGDLFVNPASDANGSFGFAGGFGGGPASGGGSGEAGGRGGGGMQFRNPPRLQCQISNALESWSEQDANVAFGSALGGFVA